MRNSLFRFRYPAVSRLCLYVVTALLLFSFFGLSVRADVLTSSEQEQLAALSVRIVLMQSALNWLQTRTLGTSGAQVIATFPSIPPPPIPAAPIPTPVPSSTPTPTGTFPSVPVPPPPSSPVVAPDITAPIISAVNPSQITSSSIFLAWNTDEAATGLVEYGFTGNYGQQTVEQMSVATIHSVTLSSLSSNSAYHFRVRSKDAAGNEGLSIDFTFTTLPAVALDTVPPDPVTNLAVANVTETSADITWNATGDNQTQGTAAQYDLRYATAPITSASFAPAAQTAGLPVPHSAGTAESYTLVGLAPGTTYYIALKISDAAGNVSFLSNVPTFTTMAAAQQSPTPTPAPSGGGSSSSSSGSSSSSSGGGGGGGGSYVLSDTTPPPAVSNLTVVGAESQITLSWKNPTVSDYTRTIVVRKESSAPTSTSDGTIVYQGMQEEFTDIKLDNSKTYYYTVYAIDGVPNYSLAAIVHGKPQAGKVSIGRSVTPSSSVVTVSFPSFAPRFTKTLAFGMRDPEVKALQQFLIQKGFLNSDNDSGYFGRLTEAAVKKFQAQYGIASSGTPQTTGYGLVGRLTRQKLNELSGTGAAPASGLTETQRVALIEQLKLQIQTLTLQLLQLQIKLLQEHAASSP